MRPPVNLSGHLIFVLKVFAGGIVIANVSVVLTVTLIGPAPAGVAAADGGVVSIWYLSILAAHL